MKRTIALKTENFCIVYLGYNKETSTYEIHDTRNGLIIYHNMSRAIALNKCWYTNKQAAVLINQLDDRYKKNQLVVVYIVYRKESGIYLICDAFINRIYKQYFHRKDALKACRQINKEAFKQLFGLTQLSLNELVKSKNKSLKHRSFRITYIKYDIVSNAYDLYHAYDDSLLQTNMSRKSALKKCYSINKNAACKILDLKKKSNKVGWINLTYIVYNKDKMSYIVCSAFSREMNNQEVSRNAALKECRIINRTAYKQLIQANVFKIK